MAKFFTLCVAALLGTGALHAQSTASPVLPVQPTKLHDGLIKVNLTDFISGKYSLSYERVIGPWTKCHKISEWPKFPSFLASKKALSHSFFSMAVKASSNGLIGA